MTLSPYSTLKCININSRKLETYTSPLKRLFQNGALPDKSVSLKTKQNPVEQFEESAQQTVLKLNLNQ